MSDFSDVMGEQALYLESTLKRVEVLESNQSVDRG
jgi:hypothetical protein